MNNLKIFEGTRVCWIGISDEEKVQMNEILISNGGAVTTLDDPSCTHFVSVFDLKRVKLRHNFALLDLVLIVLAFFDRSLIHLALAAACLKRCRANPS